MLVRPRRLSSIAMRSIRTGTAGCGSWAAFATFFSAPVVAGLW
jgi:hypothetical protein